MTSDRRQRCPATVLVVDDEENIRDLLSQTLRLVGFHVVTAAAGYEALSVAQAARPAIMVLDVMLPDIEGIDCLGPPLLHTVRGVGYALRLPRDGG